MFMCSVSSFNIFHEAPILLTVITLLNAGAPGIKQIHVCNNKRYVLTKDSGGNVASWDILKVGHMAAIAVL